MKYWFGIISFIFLCAFSCDSDGKKQCAWYLVPEPDLKEKVTEGFIPVCARNYETNKQDCRLQTTIEKAKEYYNKKFRYEDLKVTSPGLPRTIESIEFCE